MGRRRGPPFGRSSKPADAYAGLTLFFLLCTAQLAFAGALTHGPLVGAVTSDSAEVLVRACPTDGCSSLEQGAAVQIVYWTSAGLAERRYSEPSTTIPARDFTAKIRISGLVPEQVYRLDVVVDGVPQLARPYPSFRTFPEPGVSRPFKVLILTDFAKRQKVIDEASTFRSAATEAADLLFIGGDFDHRRSRSLVEFRQVYKDMYDPSTIGLQKFAEGLLRHMPFDHQYDDHDSGKNGADKSNPYKAWALQAYQEYVPHYPLPRPDLGIWHSFRYGHVEFFVLDTRSQRDPNSDLDGRDKSMLDGDGLGESGQLHWFLDALARSTAQWKVVFSSVVFNPTTRCVDGWGGFRTERRSILEFVQRRGIQGVIVVSGDLHAGAIDNGANAGLVSMVVPGADIVGCLTGRQGLWSEGFYGWPWGHQHCRGYGTLTFFTQPGEVLLEVKDDEGNVRVSYLATVGGVPRSNEVMVCEE